MVFKVSTLGARGITCYDKLDVSGIDFEVNQSDNGRSLIAVAYDGVLTLKDCSFRCEKRTDRYYGARAILVWNGAELVMENCQSRLPGVDLISVSSAGRIGLKNCDIEAVHLFSMARSSSPQEKVWVTLADSRFRGSVLFEHRAKPVLTKVAVEVVRSELDTEEVLVAFGTSKIDQVATGVFPTKDRATKIFPVSDFSTENTQ